jgi:hypothetical protein
MNPINIVTFKDAALGAVGRTVVNFQRIEHNLKIGKRTLVIDGFELLSAQQSACKQRPHVAATIGNNVDDHLFRVHPVN